jgi:RNA polymerase sigma-70 factor, ECF subfamily
VTDWDRIVTDHGPMILRLACRILGHGPDAEDVVQEAFLEGYQVAQDQEVGNWGGLFSHIAVHRSLDRLRRRRPAGPLSGAEASPHADGPQEAAVANELAQRLREAIARLPEQQATVFCLRYFDDLPYGRIAERLGLEVGAVGAALSKARGKLKSMLTVSVNED